MLINEFLKKFSERKLKHFGVINTRRNLLNGKSVEPLIRLMKKNEVKELTGPNAWFLDTDYNYYNPYSKEVRNGNLKTSNISRLGVVFDAQNKFLNPYYIGFIQRDISEENMYMSEPIVDQLEEDIRIESDNEIQNKPTEHESYTNTRIETIEQELKTENQTTSTTSDSVDLDKTILGKSGVYGLDIDNLPENYILDERYRIIEKIGTGGFGTVYKVWDDDTETFKALKIIHKHFYGDKEVISDLKREAKILMKMRSDHVVRIWDIHLRGTTKYIDMEYIDQGDLVDFKLSFPDKKIPEEEVLKLAKQIAEGMSYIHANNVIHKDIKPHNIMLAKDRIVKIMDFGISETFRSSMSRLKETSRSGTPAYMSPEQLIGEDVGKESDIWSFGVMLYELLSGKQLFIGKTTSEIHHSIREKLDVERNKETRQYSQYGSVNFPIDISSSMKQILQNCLQYNFKDRFKDFGEVEEELRKQELESKAEAQKKKIKKQKQEEQNRFEVKKTETEKQEKIHLEKLEKERIEIEAQIKLEAARKEKKLSRIIEDKEELKERTDKKIAKEKKKKPTAIFMIGLLIIISVIIYIIYSSQTVDKVETYEGSGNMVFVQGGTFLMGSNNGQDNEKPVHSVVVSDFYIGKYEVTQKEWKEIMGSNPSKIYGVSDNHPVYYVKWHNAVEFCNKKSDKEGLKHCYFGSGKNIKCDFNANGYRLPTEAEWEYAARGGNNSNGYKYSGSNNIDEVSWYSYWEKPLKKTQPVGNKQPNELGIHDMSGNVWEWCWDWYDEDYYSKSPKNNPNGPSIRDPNMNSILRGGAWYVNEYQSRVTYRKDYGRGTLPLNFYTYGIRLVRTL